MSAPQTLAILTRPFGQIHAPFPAEGLEAGQELGPGQDRRRGHRRVLFASRPLDELDGPPLFEQGVEDVLRVPELVGHGPAAGHPLEDILDDPRVPPGKQPVQVPHLRIELVVFFRADRHDRMGIRSPERLGDRTVERVDPHWVDDVALLPEGHIDRIAARWIDLIDCEECDVDPDEKPMLRELAGDLVAFCRLAEGAEDVLFAWSL